MTHMGGPPPVQPLIEGRDGVKSYRKRPVEVDVRFADRPETIATLEGAVTCVPGDAIVTGARDEVWPVARAVFEQRYEPIAPMNMGDAGRYRSRALATLAIRLSAPMRLALPSERGILSGEAGDWLVQHAPGDQAIVNGAIFDDTYESA